MRRGRGLKRGGAATISGAVLPPRRVGCRGVARARGAGDGAGRAPGPNVGVEYFFSLIALFG